MILSAPSIEKVKKSDLSLSLFRIQFFVRQHKNTLSFFLAPPADLVIPGYLCVTYVNPPNTHQILDAKPKPARLPQLYLFASELHSATAQPLILESPAFEQVLQKLILSTPASHIHTIPTSGSIT